MARSQSVVGDQLLLDHPAAAAGDHLVDREVGGQVVGADPAGGHEPHAAEGRGERPQVLHAAGRFGGEQLHYRQALRQRQADLGRRADARYDGHAPFEGERHDGGVEAGRHAESRRPRSVPPRPARRSATVPAPDADLGNLGRDRRDRLRRGARAEGDLGAGQAGIEQGARQRHGVVGVADLDHGHDQQGAEEGLNAGPEARPCPGRAPPALLSVTTGRLLQRRRS